MKSNWAQSVRVQLLSTFEANGMLEFVLIFPDHCEKHYSLDEYQIRSYRGIGERGIIEQCAKDYFEDIGEVLENIQLIFM